MAEEASIEVQINARVDKLDAGLKVAEAQVNKSAKVMGDAGEQGGNQFASRMVSGMVKGLALGAVTNVIGGGILKSIQGINAGKSGEDIGKDIATGIVDGAKSIPIAGIVVSILDEWINGMDRVVDAAIAKSTAALNTYWDVVTKINKEKSSLMQSVLEQERGFAAGDDPQMMADLSQVRFAEANQNRIAEMEKFNKDALAESDKGFSERRTLLEAKARQAEQDVSATDALGRAMGASSPSATVAQAALDDIITADKTHADHRAKIIAKNEAQIAELRSRSGNLEIAHAKKLADEITKNAQEASDKKVDAQNKVILDLARQEEAGIASSIRAQANYEKEKQAATQRAAEDAIQSQIDALQAPTMIDKQRDEMNRAQSAAQGMIQSGSTALGQFNFAQDGAANLALAVAKEQSKKLDELQKLHDTLKSIRAGVLV